MELAKQQEFDYSLVASDTAYKLRGLGNQLDGIYHNYSIAVGEVLYQAQQVLANHDNGVFGQWVESKGISRRNAYNYINSYKVVQNLHNPKKREIFLKQPKSLQFEMSKPSALPEANQAVFDGDITTHKEYKELERKLKLQERIISDLTDESSRLKEAAVKEVVKEVQVTPPDYHQAIQRSKDLSEHIKAYADRNAFLEDQLNKLSEQRDKANRYQDLEQAIERGKGLLNQQQKEIASTKETIDFIKRGSQFLANFGGVAYLDIQSVLSKNAQLRLEMETFSGQLQILLEDVEGMLQKANNEILEGEIL